MVFGTVMKKLKALKNLETKEKSLELFSKSEPSLLEIQGVSYSVITTPAQVADAVSVLLKSTTLLGIDIETYPLKEFVKDADAGIAPRKSGIRLIQIYDGQNHVFIFDLLKIGGIAQIPSALWEKTFIAHNALFELKHLFKKGITLKKMGCTLLADRVLTGCRQGLKPELRLSKKATLQALSMEILGLEISKEQQTSNWSAPELSEEQLNYAALDAVLTLKIFQKQYPLMKEHNLLRIYGLLRDAQAPIVSMMTSGIGFNVAEHENMITAWQEEAKALEALLLAELGGVLNINSGKQLNAWLKAEFPQETLENWVKTDKGSLSTSTPTFKGKEALHKAFPQIVAYRHVAKRLSSFGKNLYKFIDTTSERLYGSFTLGLTATSRLSSTNPNLQNIPRDDFRKLFKAKDGCSLICLDYGKQEVLIAALLSKDKALLDVFEKGEDIHKATASAILGIPVDKVTKADRQLAKAVNFGLLYGQGTKGLARYAKASYGVDLTEEEAAKHRTKFFDTYKGLRSWQRNTSRLAEITGKIATVCGRVRDFNKEARGFQYTISLNHGVQGAGAEVMLHALKRSATLLCDDLALVNSVHDELVFEVKDSEADKYLKLIENEMIKAFLDVFPDSEPYLKRFVEGKIGKTWQEAK